MTLRHVMNWPRVGCRVSLLAVGASVLVYQQGLEMFLVGLRDFIIAKGGNMP